LAIAFLILSALSLGLSRYLRSQGQSLSQSEVDREIDQEADLVSKKLARIFQDAAFINPPCVDNPINAASVISCAAIKVRGGIVPLPGHEWSDVDPINNVLLPANLTGDPTELERLNDAVRVVKYNFEGEQFNCSLDKTIEVNPSISEEKLWVNSECLPLLRRNHLYLIVEQFSGVAYSAAFQISEISGNQISISSMNSSFNQVGGLGLGGFTSAARIFPIKLAEYALKADEQSILSREISPTESSRFGQGSWEIYLTGVESLQLWPVTILPDASIQHQRTMAFTAEAANNGVEDIRGVLPWFVLKSSRKLQSASNLTDNPFTADAETDGLIRVQRRFFVKMDNFPN
jgi:hypothetical protein